MPDGTKMTVLAGPQQADGYYWYSLKGYVSGSLWTGWAASQSTNTSSRPVLLRGLFGVGDQVVVISDPYVNFRERPSRNANRLDSIYKGTRLTIENFDYDGFPGAVQDAEGYTWWRVTYNGRTGWVADQDPGGAGGTASL